MATPSPRPRPEPPARNGVERRRLPAEWERQAATLVTWPHDRGDWGDGLAAAEVAFTALARAITRFQPLLVVCRDHGHARHVRGRLAAAGVAAGRVLTALAPSDDAWARDHGPLTVYRRGGGVELLDFAFNGWGGRYPHADDDRLTRRLAAAGTFGATPWRRIDWVLEGGALDSDGTGSALVSRRCLLAPARNAASAAECAELLRAHLGIDRPLWLTAGWLEGDDTDGHVDLLARFCGPGTIAYQACDDPADPHHGPLGALAEELRALRTREGRPYRLAALPWPRLADWPQGRRPPASYANFALVNGAVLVPEYGDPADALARDALARLFPGREVVGVPVAALITQGGGVHCATLHLPAGVEVIGATEAGP